MTFSEQPWPLGSKQWRAQPKLLPLTSLSPAPKLGANPCSRTPRFPKVHIWPAGFSPPPTTGRHPAGVATPPPPGLSLLRPESAGSAEWRGPPGDARAAQPAPSQPVPRRGRFVPSPDSELLRRSHGALSAGGSRLVPRTAPQRSPRAASTGRRVGTPKGPRSQGHQASAGREAESAPERRPCFTYTYPIPLPHYHHPSFAPTTSPPPFLALSIHDFFSFNHCIIVFPSLSDVPGPRSLRQAHRQAAVGPTPASCPVGLWCPRPKALSTINTTILGSQPGLEKGRILGQASEETEEPPGLISPSVK